MSLEFGMTLPLLMVALLTCVDLGRYVAARTALRAAVAEVVRAAMLDAALTGCVAPKGFAVSRVELLDAASLSLCVARATGSLTVTAEYAFSFVMPTFGTAPRTLRATVTTPV